MDSKTYYALSYLTGYYLKPAGENGTTTLAEAQHFDTVTAALRAIARSGCAALDWQIVRVTEKPVKKEVTICSRTIIDATKPCVVAGRLGAVFFADQYTVTEALDAARVFPDLNEALAFVYGPLMSDMNDTLKVFNVVVSESQPTVTAEVVR
jgi:uncharacterized protein (DUF1501 family)